MSMFSISFNYTISVLADKFKDIPVEWIVSVQLLIAGVIMIILSLLSKNKNQKAVLQLFIFGIFGMIAVQYTYITSINLENAAVATLLQYLASVFIITYLIVAKISKWDTRNIVAIILTLSGTFLLLTNGSLFSLSVPFASIVWGILSGVALAFYTLYARQLLHKWGSLNVIGWAMIIGELP